MTGSERWLKQERIPCLRAITVFAKQVKESLSDLSINSLSSLPSLQPRLAGKKNKKLKEEESRSQSISLLLK